MFAPRQKILGVCLLIALSLVGQAVVAGTWFAPHKLAVWIFDVGQGDAIFIDAPNKQVLIDGGPNDAILEKLASVLPPWDRSLDLVIATHPHADHVLGLDAVLERYSVGQIVDDGLAYDSAAALGFEKLGGATATVASRGLTWDLGEGAKLEVIWPDTITAGTFTDDVNDGSIVVLLTYGDTTILLTGDAVVAQEDKFAATLPHIDILKVGHHGSDTSSGPNLINAITPDYALIPVGADNSYGHPSKIILNRLIQAGATIFRTDTHGDLRVLTQGGEPTITNFLR
jgi:competence protein ComEC